MVSSRNLFLFSLPKIVLARARFARDIDKLDPKRQTRDELIEREDTERTADGAYETSTGEQGRHTDIYYYKWKWRTRYFYVITAQIPRT